MATEYPQSVQEAEDHIRQIRLAKGLVEDASQIGNNASDLEAALRVLSHDLYQTPTHFLLELIQNADDNQYENEPTLSISYSPGRLRIDCNERGFSKKNVEAICRIGQSTKSGLNKKSGFVGEKGIGFKAVFKAASVVWISSGFYSFKFDRDGMLGMIAPVWAAFPTNIRPGHTSIYLQLSKDCDERALTKELRSYDPRILMFLRRLRKLEIAINPGGFKTKLSRHDQPSTNPAFMTLQDDGEEKHYMVWRHVAADLPHDDRRAGISSSEISLAFPLSKELEEPLLEKQNVYAFLPVRDYGFQFLLQADFLLPANREEVKGDSVWNAALISAAVDGFVDAAQYMSRSDSKLRHQWIRYVPTQRAQSVPFEQFRQTLLSRLRNTPLLYSQAGSLECPRSMTRVPDRFCDHEKRPFMLNSSNGQRFLDGSYNDYDKYDLGAIGVEELTDKAFFQQLAASIDEDPQSFYAERSSRWHTSFARALIPLASSESMKTLALIPLRTKQWVRSGDEGPFFFPHGSTGGLLPPKVKTSIPEGIQISVVDVDATRNPDRRRLLSMLGVKNFGNDEISALIIATHQSTDFLPTSLQPDVLVSHAVFVFNSRWENANGEEMWFAAENGSCRKGSSMYLPSDDAGAASHYLPQTESTTYGFLHSGYLNVEGVDQSKWLEWLQKQLKVSKYPRLASDAFETNAVMEGERLVHDDFKLIMQTRSSSEYLTLLRDGWQVYSGFLVADDSPFRSSRTDRNEQKSKLNEYLRIQEVQCFGGATTAPLAECFLSVPELVSAGRNMVPLLQIPAPEDPCWHCLSNLGVGVKPDLRFYLQCLKSIKRREQVDWEQVQTVMDRLQAKVPEAPEHLKLLRDSLNDHALIYIPPRTKDGAAIWTSSRDCVWKGEPWFIQTIHLDTVYPNNETLFQIYLCIPNAGIDHVIKEAGLVHAGHKTSYIADIFKSFTHHMHNRDLTRQQKAKIAVMRLFPVVSTQENDPYDYLALIRNPVDWLVADREDFRVQFQGQLPVLALSVDDVLYSQKFLRAVGLEDRLLSKVAKPRSETEGAVLPNLALTARYRARSDFVFRLIPHDKKDQSQLREQFRDIEVFTAARVLRSWRVTIRSNRIRSASAECPCFLKREDSGKLKIFLRRGYESEGNPLELVDELSVHFEIPPNHRDLLTAVLTANLQRVKELFRSRGVPPLLGDDGLPTNDPETEPELELQQAGISAGTSNPDLLLRYSTTGTTLLTSTSWHGSIPRIHGIEPSESWITGNIGSTMRTRIRGPRFARLLHLHGEDPRSFRDTSLSWALPDSTENGISDIPPSYTLTYLKEALKELDYAPPQTRSQPSFPNLFGRVEGPGPVDVAISGDKLVSDLLSCVLGSQFNSDLMWTGRRRRGNSRLLLMGEQPADFTFKDRRGRFTTFMMHLNGLKGCRMEAETAATEAITYHLDIKTTEGDQSEMLELSQAELDRARRLSVHTMIRTRLRPKHVSILVRISEVRNDAKFIFAADPWSLFYDGQLSVENPAEYHARLRPRAPAGPDGCHGVPDAPGPSYTVSTTNDRR